MTIEAADASAGRVSYLAEKFFGTPVTPFDAQIMQLNSSSLNPNKTTVRSNQLRADGMRGKSIETAFDSNGTFTGELSGGGVYDELFEAMLRGIWDADSSTETIRFIGAVTFTNATSNVNAVGAFANASVGDKFYVRNANNGGQVLTIATVTDDDNVVVNETLSDEAVTADCSLVGYPTMAINSTGALQVTAATRTFTLTGAFVNAVPEQAFYVGNMVNSGNNGWHVIETVTDDNNVVVYTTAAELTDETGPGTAFVKGNVVRNGTVKRSATFETYLSDRDYAFVFKGQRIGTMALKTEAEGIVTVDFGVMGTEAVNQSGELTGTRVALPNVDVMNATSNVAKLRLGNVQVSCIVQDINLNADNVLRKLAAVGSKFPCQIGYGSQTINGRVTLYFQDDTYFEIMRTHALTSLEWAYTDIDGNSIHFYLPAVRFANDTAANLPGLDQDVDEAIDFEVEPHSEGFHAQISVYTP